VNRYLFKAGAVAGVASIAMLAAGPAMAAGEPVSQATAQSLNLSIAGTSAVSQQTSSVNDGTGEKSVDNSTVPKLADLIKGNNALGLGVAPQATSAKVDSNGNGISYACAGIAGTGGGIVTVGDTSCNIDGKPLTLSLANLNLDLTDLLGSTGAITGPLRSALDPILGANGLGGLLDGLVSQLTGALAGTPLGDIAITGGLSAVEATCTANPDKATGDAQIVDTSGHHSIPISVTLPGVGPQVIANLDVDLPNKPGGTDVLVNLSAVTQDLIDNVDTELKTALGGALAGLADPVVKTLLQPLQNTLLKPLLDALKPVLQAVSDNLLKITVNDVTPGDNGRSVEATALKLSVLPAAKQFVGSSLIDGTIGHVTCGPNSRVAAPPSNSPSPSPTATPTNPNNNVPTNVDSGVAGDSSHTNEILAAVAALLALTGVAGAAAYRRYGMPRG